MLFSVTQRGDEKSGVSGAAVLSTISSCRRRQTGGIATVGLANPVPTKATTANNRWYSVAPKRTILHTLHNCRCSHSKGEECTVGCQGKHFFRLREKKAVFQLCDALKKSRLISAHGAQVRASSLQRLQTLRQRDLIAVGDKCINRHRCLERSTWGTQGRRGTVKWVKFRR